MPSIENLAGLGLAMKIQFRRMAKEPAKKFSTSSPSTLTPQFILAESD
jgi:hypothetical protein